jgi:hypothetical protein
MGSLCLCPHHSVQKNGEAADDFVGMAHHRLVVLDTSHCLEYDLSKQQQSLKPSP